jgi:phosphinothricin acetyltransferase
MSAARIRLAAPDDGGALAGIYAPAVVERTTSFELEPPDASEMMARVQRVLARTPWLVAEDGSGRVVGYAYAGPHRGDRPAYQWSVEVSAYVSDRVHRGGIGRALYSALFDLLRLQGFRNAYAGITLPNPASEKFHRAMGFELVGVYERVGYKMGAWRDVAWSALPLAPHDLEPAPPLPLPELLHRPEFAAVLERASAALRPR